MKLNDSKIKTIIHAQINEALKAGETVLVTNVPSQYRRSAYRQTLSRTLGKLPKGALLRTSLDTKKKTLTIWLEKDKKESMRRQRIVKALAR